MNSSGLPIRLIAADIDGCFTDGGRFPIDLDVARAVREFNHASRTDSAIPALVFCTGRPLGYVMAMHQVIDAWLPSLCENGAVMWDPAARRHRVHPAYTPQDRDWFREITSHIESELVAADPNVQVEEGKFVQATVYPMPPLTMDELAARVKLFAAKWQERFVVDYTHSVINFMPPAINKGTGLQWLSQSTGIPLTQIAGLGDADSDWDFLQHCAISATPSNGRELVKSKCHWCLEKRTSASVMELYERLIARNRELIK